MKKNYLKALLKMYPHIASGRKNFKNHENRVKKNLILTDKYFKKTKNYSNK